MFIALAAVIGIVWGWSVCSLYKEARSRREFQHEWVDFCRAIASKDGK